VISVSDNPLLAHPSKLLLAEIGTEHKTALCQR